MQELTLVYRGKITVETNSNTSGSVSSRFERGYVRPWQHRGFPEFIRPSGGTLSVHDLDADVDGGDVEYSEAPVDRSLTGFLDRHSDLLEEVVETELRRVLPTGSRASVRLSFWQGSVAFAATVTLLLVGKHYAQREALNFIQVACGPPISRCLRHVISKVGKTGPRSVVPFGITIELDPSSVATIEALKKNAERKLDRFDRKAQALTAHVYWKGIRILIASLTAIAIAIILGVSYGASWLDALKAIFGR